MLAHFLLGLTPQKRKKPYASRASWVQKGMGLLLIKTVLVRHALRSAIVCFLIALRTGRQIIDLMANQLQQLFFISAVTVGITICANTIQGMTITAGHFHHRGVRCHGSSFPGCANLQKEKQRRGEASRVAYMK